MNDRLAPERFGIVVTMGSLVASMALYLATPGVHTPGSDGAYSWLYARSLVFDGDIDFANDYRLCGDRFAVGIDRGTGHPDNIFYPGPALFWAPLLLVARAFLPGDPDGTCGPPWSTFALGIAPFLLAVTAYSAYRLLRRRFADGIAALAVALLVFGGPAMRVASVLPSYSHVHDAACVTVFLLAAVRAIEGPSHPLRWAWVVLALAAAVLHRISNAAFASVPVAVALVAHRSHPRRLLPALVATAGGLAVGLGTMGVIYRYLYGSPLVFTHGRYFIDFGQAHPWLMLLDREEGLFFHFPVVWLAVLGLPFGLRDRNRAPLLLPLLGIAGLEWWLCAAALDWSPARRLTNLTPLFALLAAYPLDAVRRWFGQASRAVTALGLAAAVPAVVYGVGYAWGVPRGMVPSERPLTQAELYGGAARGFWALVDDTVGGVALWPAERLFRARYGLPGSRLGEAAFPRWYVRDFRSLEFGPRGLFLVDPAAQRLARGLVPVEGGMRPTELDPSLVFAAQWREATHLAVVATVTEPIFLRVGLRPPLGRTHWCGDARELLPGQGPLVLEVPRGAFASGINEVRFELSPASLRALTLRAVTFDDRTPLRPAFE
ncbi:MAG: hypothetical protein JW751_21455 [Polyangiaceae bacterium]|nr:hypothetical protein [Polyangiaceae bacterium]